MQKYIMFDFYKEKEKLELKKKKEKEAKDKAFFDLLAEAKKIFSKKEGA